MTAQSLPVSSALSGVLPVFQTPFHEDESIDKDALGRELDWLLERGADGVVMAMVSEVLRLSTDERREMTQFVCHAVGKRGKTVISVGAESTHMAVDLARHAESCGATAVMAIPPISVGLGPEELLNYYRRILDATQIPLIVQDASGFVGRPMPIDTQANLLDEHGPDRILFKPESTPIGPRLSALRDATAGRARIFDGNGGIALVDSFRRGIAGTMPGANLIDGIVALYKALVADNSTRVYQLSLPISSLVALQSGVDAFLAVEKYLLKKQGVFTNTVVRGPVGFHLDAETQREVDRLFELIQEAIRAPVAKQHI